MFKEGEVKLKPCKFSLDCISYDPESYTCTHNGGGYCGVYREKEKGAL